MSVINMFLELGLPFILRFINDWRAGKTTIKEAVKNVQHPLSEKGVATSSEEAEKKFLEKVEKELALPDYNLFSMSFSLFLFFFWSSLLPPERSKKLGQKEAGQEAERTRGLTSSRLRRDGHSIRICHDLEYRLAPRSDLCLDQQLCRAPSRRFETMPSCSKTCWG